MKILRKLDTSQWNYKYTCGKCDTEMEVEKGDLKYKYMDGDRNEMGQDTFAFNCPACGDVSFVPLVRIPKLVQIEVKKGVPAAGVKYSTSQWDR